MVSSGALAARKLCAAADLAHLPGTVSSCNLNLVQISLLFLILFTLDDDDVWNTWAYYVAQLCVNLVLIASPERIAIG